MRQYIVDDAIKILETTDDGGLDCIKTAMLKAFKSRGESCSKREWSDLFDEIVYELQRRQKLADIITR